MPNPRRLPNPFTPSDEPDWIPIPASHGRLRLKEDDDAEQQAPAIVTRSSPAQDHDHRVLPDSNHGREDSRDKVEDRLTRTFSTSSSMSRKSAPPVPKKPQTLTSSNKPRHAATKEVHSSTTAYRPTPSNLSAHDDAQIGHGKTAPALPIRRIGRTDSSNITTTTKASSDVSRKSVPVEELMDDDGDQAQSIPSLQPTPRQ